MEITSSEERKNKRTAMGITLFSFLIMIMFLVFKNILTSDMRTAVQSQDMTLGFSNGGNNNSANEKLAMAASAKSGNSNSKENLASDPNEKLSLKTSAEQLADQFRSRTNSNGNSQTENVVNPSPGVTPTGIGAKGTEASEKVGESKLGYELRYRTMVSQPKLENDTQEEGTVIVEIVVDKAGNVIEANPNGRGTTTSSSVLKAKAKKIAAATKFSPHESFEEQGGRLTIIFSYN